MTTITVFRRKDGALTGFRASGHADAGKYGHDIVCAAISVLTQSVGQGITDVAKARASVRMDENTGFYEVLLDESQDDASFEKAQVLLKTLENSLIAMNNDTQYSAFIRINYSERR